MEEWINRAWTALLVAGPTLAASWMWFRSQVNGLKEDAVKLARDKAEADAQAEAARDKARLAEIELREREAKLREAEAKAEGEETEARQLRKQQEIEWAVKQAMALYEESKAQVAAALHRVDKVVCAETRCRVLAGTLWTRLRELERKARPPVEKDPSLERWVDEVINPREGKSGSDDPTAAGDAHG